MAPGDARLSQWPICSPERRVIYLFWPICGRYVAYMPRHRLIWPISIIPLIAQDYVPQSFVDVDKDDYLKATIVFYELNDARPLAELYCWAYRRSCLHFDTAVRVVGFDEIAALYRPFRRALVAELVRSLVPPGEVMGFIETRITNQVQPQHRDKFKQDVLAELHHLDISRMGGLGITREQLEAWLNLRTQQS